MMKPPIPALLVLLLFSSQVMAVSVLRVHCPIDAEGAEIFVNGEPKGYCPTDLFISPGEKTLRAVKPVDEDRERVFETHFILAEDGAKRVRVELSAPQLTAEAKRKRRKARLAREKKAAEQALEKAEDGAPDAMRELAGYYRDGQGVPENPEKAQAWETRASEIDAQRSASRTLDRAQGGSIPAMQRMADRYESGDGVPRDAEKAKEWRARADRAIADNTLEKAENGDVASMKAMARFYREGKGVEASADKADEWTARAEKIVADREKRKKERKEREAARERLDNIDFFANVKMTTDMSPPENPLEAGLLVSYSPLFTVTGVVGDLVSAPTKTVEMVQLKQKIATRASSFENPDSMIAQAYSNEPTSPD